jgi:DNA-binding transcriptional MerR regulator
MNIKEASTMSGLSVDTIRFYEKAGMLPRVTRDRRGWRSFDGDTLDWLKTLERLRATGMPLKDMKRFATLSGDGAAEVKERLAILERHAERLVQRRADLDACQAFLDFKIGFYRKAQGGK